jgi:hypothetical protein
VAAERKEMKKVTRIGRRRAGGAAMIEALFVISIMVSFFIAMVYVRSLYENKLHVQRLGRAAALAYAMSACKDQGDPLLPIRPDLGSAKNSGTSGAQQGNNPSSAITPQSTQNVGDKGGDPVSGAMKGSGFVGDPLALFTLDANAAATVPQGWTTATAFQHTVRTIATISCGDKQEAGDVKGAIHYVIDEFNLK